MMFTGIRPDTIVGGHENRLEKTCAAVPIENRKIIHWRGCMDSLAVWTADSAPP